MGTFENSDSAIWDLNAVRTEQVADMAASSGVGMTTSASDSELKAARAVLDKKKIADYTGLNAIQTHQVKS